MHRVYILPVDGRKTDSNTTTMAMHRLCAKRQPARGAMLRLQSLNMQ